MERILKDLQVSGHELSLWLRPIHGEKNEKCLPIDDLVVAPRYYNSKLNEINLPRTYSTTRLPVDSEDIPTSEKLGY